MRTKRNRQLGTILSALILSVLTAYLFFGTANGNPGLFWAEYQGIIEAPYPPLLTITKPENNSILNRDTISFSLKVSIQLSEENLTSGNYMYSQHLAGIYYTSDWLAEERVISGPRLHQNDTYFPQPHYYNYKYNLSLTDIPDGEHYIRFRANEAGVRITSGEEYWTLSTNASLTLGFTVDTTKPRVVITSIENKTYSYSDIPLVFNVDEPVSEVLYVLDGKESVRGSGNTTLNGLPDGVHNVTVHVWDEAGNFGSSETVQFNVEAAALSTFVWAFVFGVSAAFAVVGVFLWKKRSKRVSR